MIVISFLKGPCVEYTYSFFIITTNITIIKSTDMYLHLVYYILILTFPLEGGIGFIDSFTFKEPNMLLILEFFSVTFINQICHIRYTIVT